MMRPNRDVFSRCFSYSHAEKVLASGLYPYFRAIQETCGRTVVTEGKRRVMIGSNNYLGLTHDPRVIAAAQKAVARYGVGCTGSRFLNGNLDLHDELESRLAKFLGREECLVFSTGFLANQGTISCLMGKDDVIISDRENHASIVEGTRAAISDTIRFKHNDMNDLERVLKKHRDQYNGALIVVDGVFSMSGDIIRLPDVVELARRYDCRVYVDEAHALGVLGPRGEGTGHHFGMPEAVDLVMGTFSKSFASIGGFVAGEKKIMHYIRHKARSFMFSAAMPPGSVGSVLACLDIIETEPHHLVNLRNNAKFMSESLTQLGFETLGSKTPIVPILVGMDERAFVVTKRLYDLGVFVTPVVSPAVPSGCALIRTSTMASHTRKELDEAVCALEKVGREFEIIGNKAREKELAQLASSHFGAYAASSVYC